MSVLQHVRMVRVTIFVFKLQTLSVGVVLKDRTDLVIV